MKKNEYDEKNASDKKESESTKERAKGWEELPTERRVAWSSVRVVKRKRGLFTM